VQSFLELQYQNKVA